MLAIADEVSPPASIAEPPVPPVPEVPPVLPPVPEVPPVLPPVPEVPPVLPPVPEVPPVLPPVPAAASPPPVPPVTPPESSSSHPATNPIAHTTTNDHLVIKTLQLVGERATRNGQSSPDPRPCHRRAAPELKRRTLIADYVYRAARTTQLALPTPGAVSLIT